MPEVEEIFDLIFYRPLAFVFVKTIYKFPVTPNQITLLSMIIGLLAAWQFSLGTTEAMIIAGLFLIISNILDCVDGQLARLQKSGTLLGRVIDGIADYIVGVAIFVSIGIGLSAQGFVSWLMVIFTGASSALHAMFFDHYQSEFISVVRAEKNFPEKEIEQFTTEVQLMRSNNRGGVKILLLALYLRYLAFQRNASIKSEAHYYIPDIYRKENSLMIRLWSFLGPTTNRTILILCAFAGSIDLYFRIILVIGNLWLITSYLLQRRIYRRLQEM